MANATADKTTPNDDVIKFSAEEFAKITKTSRATPSPYESIVKNAVPNEGYGIRIREGVQSRTIVNNLHKAAKAVGVKVQVRVREKATPPIVTFQLVNVTPVAESSATE